MDEYNNIQGEINALKSLLLDTDYKVLKFVDGEIPAEEYAKVKADRQAWRAEINRLEDKLAAAERSAHE